MAEHTQETAAFELPLGVSRDFLVHHRMCPTGRRADGSVAVAVSRESHREGLDDLSFAFDADIVEQVVSSDEVFLLIERITSPTEPFGDFDAGDKLDAQFTSDVRDLANQPPVVRYVNFLFQEAYEAGASDIHLEATKAGLSIRFRIDGVLTEGPSAPPRMDRAALSRIKLLADLDIAERRSPQDGRIRVKLTDRDLDIRVSTVPTMFGESVVLRLLQQSDQEYGLSDLGLPAADLALLRSLTLKSHGMILATGPTGSGKTTTLYSGLRLRNAETEKIITLEDPIEHALDGIAQVPVQREAGITFASALRSILRHDPDVIMVGEMRDTETAQLAVQAALTGHLLLSTLHTNDATGAIPRLLDLGVPPFLVAATLRAVLAQRLVRRVCSQCRERYFPPRGVLRSFLEALRDTDGQDIGHVISAPGRFTRGHGCPACRGTGYRGRIGLFELLAITDQIREAITENASDVAVKRLAVSGGMRPLRVDGWEKVQAGLTTIEEVVRVTQA